MSYLVNKNTSVVIKLNSWYCFLIKKSQLVNILSVLKESYLQKIGLYIFVVGSRVDLNI